MSKRTDKQRRDRAARKAAKAAAMKEPGYESNYARKRAYCLKHECWGFEVPEPKPWKRAA